MKAKGFAQLGAIFTLFIVPPASQASTIDELLITEVMANPAAVSDSLGEWFELYNRGDSIIDLDGLILQDDGSNEYHFDGPLPINPGEYFVLARNGDPASNGGFIADHVYSNFTLSNSSDEIIISDGLTELLRLDYGSGFAVAGQSRELDSPLTGSYSLTLSSLTYGIGDIGTPGAPGNTSLPVSTVPIPAAGWLFVSAILTLLGLDYRSWNRNTPPAFSLA